MTQDMQPRFKIGRTFITGKKNKQTNTIVDIFTTTNSDGKVVRIRYVTEHTFMGQVVRESDVLDITIAKALFEAGDAI
jgi:hypothetical protein